LAILQFEFGAEIKLSNYNVVFLSHFRRQRLLYIVFIFNYIASQNRVIESFSKQNSSYSHALYWLKKGQLKTLTFCPLFLYVFATRIFVVSIRHFAKILTTYLFYFSGMKPHRLDTILYIFSIMGPFFYKVDRIGILHIFIQYSLKVR
jgi:hypothetical protein